MGARKMKDIGRRTSASVVSFYAIPRLSPFSNRYVTYLTDGQQEILGSTYSIGAPGDSLQD